LIACIMCPFGEVCKERGLDSPLLQVVQGTQVHGGDRNLRQRHSTEPWPEDASERFNELRGQSGGILESAGGEFRCQVAIFGEERGIQTFLRCIAEIALACYLR
jgi:hypothetical protein